MRKYFLAEVLLIFVILQVMLFASACAPAPAKPNLNPAKEQHFKEVKSFEGFATYTVIQDVETGCMYLEKEKGITAYYDENGEVMGCFGTSSNTAQ